MASDPCSCTAEGGCDEEGTPGCAFCRSLDGEEPCPADPWALAKEQEVKFDLDAGRPLEDHERSRSTAGEVRQMADEYEAATDQLRQIAALLREGGWDGTDVVAGVRGLIGSHELAWEKVHKGGTVTEQRTDPMIGATDENASVEVFRWGPDVWLAIRSEQSVGKAIALTREEAREVADLLKRAANSTGCMVRDEPQA